MSKHINDTLSDDFTIFTYNIQYARQLENIGTTLEKIGKDTDIICLQEVNHFEDKLKVKGVINKALSKYESMYYEDPSFGRYVGFATFWNKDKLKLINSYKILLPKFNDHSPIHHRVIMSTANPRRGALITTFKLKDNKKLRVINLHLDWRGKYTHRLNQLKFIKNYMSKLEKVNCEIICGDFNTIGSIWFLNRGKSNKRQDDLLSVLGSNYNSVIRDEIWTHDGLASIAPLLPFAPLMKLLAKIGMHYYQKLDYIFVKGLAVVESEVMIVIGSDHYPIIAKLKLKSP